MGRHGTIGIFGNLVFKFCIIVGRSIARVRQGPDSRYDASEGVGILIEQHLVARVVFPHITCGERHLGCILGGHVDGIAHVVAVAIALPAHLGSGLLRCYADFGHLRHIFFGLHDSYG